MSLSDQQRALVLDDALLERLADTVTVIDESGHIQATTASTRETLGYDSGSWVGRSITDLVHPGDLDDLTTRLTALCHDPEAEVEGEIRVRHALGHWEIEHFSAVNRLDTPLAGIVVTSHPVTAERLRGRLREAENGVLELIGNGANLAETFYAIARLVESSSNDGVAAVLLLDEQDVLRAGAAPHVPERLFRTVDGLQVDPANGSLGGAVHRRAEHRVDDVAAEPTLDSLRDVFAGSGLRGYWSVPITYASRDYGLGSIVTFYPHGLGPSPYEREAVLTASRLAGIAIERDRLESDLHRLAEHDLLTGLPNRATLTGRLDRLLRRPPGDRVVAVMFLDLDAFNLINDSLGHAAGDTLLAMFADRCRHLLPDHTTFARFGGDEFVILIDHPDGAEEARRIAATIEQALALPFRLGDQDVFLTASIGVATLNGSSTVNETLGNADTAMYQAKARGRGSFVVFEEGMRAEVEDRLQAESRLRHAIDRHEFTLRYQPKIDLETGEIIGAEALLRWNHPSDGLVGPSEVIPWAENTGLIVQLGAWVLETALSQARAWIDATGRADAPFILAVNVSGRQLSSPGFPVTVAETLARYDWPPESLTLEITESVMISDTETSLEALRRIKELGVLLAVDDFGTGYSSLNYLHRFPIDIVKVDRTFVADMAGGSPPPVAAAVVAMTHALRLIAAAEGIETAEQLTVVRQLGCHWGQGFLFSPAVPPDEFTKLLRGRPSW